MPMRAVLAVLELRPQLVPEEELVLLPEAPLLARPLLCLPILAWVAPQLGSEVLLLLELREVAPSHPLRISQKLRMRSGAPNLAWEQDEPASPMLSGLWPGKTGLQRR